jgi:hypothetical protein
MAVRVVINNGSMGDFLATDPTTQRALETVAENVMAKAVDNTPIGTSVRFGPFNRRGKKVWSHRHNYYRKLYELRRYRGGYRLWNRGAFAHLVEWGSANNPAYAPIRRAVRSSGLRYKPNANSRGQ